MTVNYETGEATYTHYKLRAAHVSLCSNLDYLFTYKNFHRDPLECILCGSQLLLTGTVIGLSSKQFINHHEQIAKRKRII